MTAQSKLTVAEIQKVEQDLDDATDRLEAGRYGDALTRAGIALSWLQGRGVSGPRIDTYIGHAHQVMAVAHAGLGELDRAIAEYGRAEKVLSRHPDNRESLVRVMHDLAILLVDDELHAMAVEVLKRAKRVARDVEGPYFEEIAAFLENLSIVEAETGARPEDLDSQIGELRRSLARERETDALAVTRANLAGLLLAYGPSESQTEAQDLLVRALRHMRGQRMWDKYVGGLSVLMVALQRPVSIGLDVIDELTQALVATARMTNPTWQHEVYTTAAALLHTQEVLAPLRGRMLELALRAVALEDTVAARIRSTLVRAMQGMRSGDTARFIALTVAADSGDHGLFIELLESSRLQVLPVRKADEAEVKDHDNLAHALARTGTVGLSPIHPLEVDAPSRLRPFFAPDAVTPVDIPLFDVIAAVGGAAAWWWGAHILDQRYFWAVVSPTLELSVGYQDLNKDDLDVLAGYAQSVNAEGAPIESLLLRPLCASPASEEAISLAVGEILLPLPLRAALWDSQSRWPASLVVASRFLAALPVGLLGIHDRPGRLLEKATVRWAPTAPIVQTAAGHPVYYADEYPVGVACIDADGTLKHAAATSGPFEIVLRNTAAITDRTTLPASRSHLARALGDLGPSSPRIAFFTGHSDDGIAGVDAALVLEDGLLTQGRVVS